MFNEVLRPEVEGRFLLLLPRNAHVSSKESNVEPASPSMAYSQRPGASAPPTLLSKRTDAKDNGKALSLTRPATAANAPEASLTRCNKLARAETSGGKHPPQPPFALWSRHQHRWTTSSDMGRQREHRPDMKSRFSRQIVATRVALPPWSAIGAPGVVGGANAKKMKCDVVEVGGNE